MKIVLFLRKPYKSQYSIERVYYSLLPYLENKIDIQVCVMPFKSKGIIRRLMNGIYAWFQKGDLNHISGDINYISSFLPKKGSILTIHDIYSINVHSGIRKLIFETFWFKWPISRVQQIIFISEFTCKQVVARYNIPKTKYTIILNSISSDFLNNQSIQKKVGPPNILQIGVKENKNLSRVIEALKEIDCKLIIVGKPSNIQKSEMKNHQISFEYHESVSNKELNDLYELSDLVLFVSTYEGFGLPIIEAQAAGRPLITSNITSMPEIAGKGALLVDPYSVNEIRSGIKRILKDETYRIELVELGRENVKRFAPKVISEEYLRLYKNLASSLK